MSSNQESGTVPLLIERLKAHPRFQELGPAKDPGETLLSVLCSLWRNLSLGHFDILRGLLPADLDLLVAECTLPHGCQLILASAPLRHSGSCFGRSSALRTTRHFGRDAVGLEGKSVAVGAGFKKRGDHDARFALLDGEADNHGASFVRAQSETGKR